MLQRCLRWVGRSGWGGGTRTHETEQVALLTHGKHCSTLHVGAARSPGGTGGVVGRSLPGHQATPTAVQTNVLRVHHRTFSYKAAATSSPPKKTPGSAGSVFSTWRKSIRRGVGGLIRPPRLLKPDMGGSGGDRFISGCEGRIRCGAEDGRPSKKTTR